jgi:primase-polymerase (primpol)-like protein
MIQVKNRDSLFLDRSTAIQSNPGQSEKYNIHSGMATAVEDYPTQSEADCALISKLWYYCGDRCLVDRAFRQSNLMRDNWDQHSYREATLTYTRDNDRHEGQYLDPSQS